MSEPVWNTRKCADHLGVSTWFIRAEIERGRLKADVFPRRTPLGGERCLIRIPLSKFRDYCQEYWPEAVKRLPQIAA